MTDLPPTEDASAAALPIIDAGSANDDAPTAAQARAERRLQVRAALLLLATVALLVCSGLYLMWIRGAFEETQRLILLSDDAEGVQVGMDMTFAGFPIGRVRSFGLGEDARVRIVVDVPVKDIKWLRAWSAAPACAPSPACWKTNPCRLMLNAKSSAATSPPKSPPWWPTRAMCSATSSA